MILVTYVDTDETAFYCDMAEVYGILEWEKLPVRIAAKLAAGLPPDSRIALKVAGVKTRPPMLVLQSILIDEVRALRYGLSSGKKEPVLMTDLIQQEVQAPEKEVKTFKTGREFDAAWAKATGN